MEIDMILCKLPKTRLLLENLKAKCILQFLESIWSWCIDACLQNFVRRISFWKCVLYICTYVRIFVYSNLGVNGVPGDTIDRPGVAAEDGNGLVPLDVEDVHLVVLGTRGYKGLVHASKTAVDHVKALQCSNIDLLESPVKCLWGVPGLFHWTSWPAIWIWGPRVWVPGWRYWAARSGQSVRMIWWCDHISTPVMIL